MRKAKPNMDQVAYIIDVVSSITNINREKIFSRDRHRDIVMARYMIYYILYRYCSISYSCIGEIMNRTHASVMFGVDSVLDWDSSNKFRDRAAVENNRILNSIVDKLSNDKCI